MSICIQHKSGLHPDAKYLKIEGNRQYIYWKDDEVEEFNDPWTVEEVAKFLSNGTWYIVKQTKKSKSKTSKRRV